MPIFLPQFFFFGYCGKSDTYLFLAIVEQPGFFLHLVFLLCFVFRFSFSFFPTEKWISPLPAFQAETAESAVNPIALQLKVLCRWGWCVFV